MRAALKPGLLSVCAAAIALAGVSLYGADYLTEGVHNARTGWMRNEKIFNTTNVRTMKLLRKITADSTPRQMHNLFAPLIKEACRRRAARRSWRSSLAFRDELFAYDVSNGELMWRRKFDSVPAGHYRQRQHALSWRPDGGAGHPADAHQWPHGDVHAVSWDGRLHTLDLATGQDIVPPKSSRRPTPSRTR